MTATLTKLQADAEKARATYEKAQADAVAAHQAAEQRRQVALAKYDQARLNAYDAQALDHDTQAAQQRLRDAVLTDPVWSAAADLYAARVRAYTRHGEALGDAARIGADFTASSPGVPAVAVMDEILRSVERRGAAVVADEADVRDAERNAAGEAATQ